MTGKIISPENSYNYATRKKETENGEQAPSPAKEQPRAAVLHKNTLLFEIINI
jgi:hypothetical protein